MATRIGRPPKCGGCGECPRCKRAAYMRDWYAKRSLEERREMRSTRNPDLAREQDRRKMLKRRHHGTAEQKLKIKARRDLNNAVNSGRIQRGPCEFVARGDCDGPVHGHHDDYTKPLDVRWMCRRHHDEHHDVRRERA